MLWNPKCNEIWSISLNYQICTEHKHYHQLTFRLECYRFEHYRQLNLKQSHANWHRLLTQHLWLRPFAVKPNVLNEVDFLIFIHNKKRKQEWGKYWENRNNLYWCIFITNIKASHDAVLASRYCYRRFFIERHTVNLTFKNLISFSKER